MPCSAMRSELTSHRPKPFNSPRFNPLPPTTHNPPSPTTQRVCANVMTGPNPNRVSGGSHGYANTRANHTARESSGKSQNHIIQMQSIAIKHVDCISNYKHNLIIKSLCRLHCYRKKKRVKSDSNCIHRNAI